jgi:mono/diheme cytochrome c family protein
MIRPLICLCLLSAAAWALSPVETPSIPPAATHSVDFAREIQPLLEASCVTCHAKGKVKGGFSIETRELFLKGGDSGPGATVGKSAESYVVELVAGLDPDNVMPKKGSRWTREQVALLRGWIDQGAVWPEGVTLSKPEPRNLHPRTVELPRSPEAHPLDALLAQYAAKHGLVLPPPVDDRTFARRAYLDIVGLLPTGEQLDAFLFDSGPDKRLRLVRTLLADQRNYAEHWLTFWNDHLRNDYKGTGFIDGGRRQITGWLYRSLVENKPYDRFVGELVQPRDETSEPFSRGIIWRGVVNSSMLPPMQAAQNISQVFLGVNLKCASCHDSFVNDWALADAYGVAAVFSDEPLELVHCDKPTGTFAAPRGLYPQLGAIDPGLARQERIRRFTEILTSRENGRLSRTIVNRYWARLIGRGFVEPLDDMDLPAWSPEMLDFLAEDFVAGGHDLKRLIERIATSRAYQLPSVEHADEDQPEDYVFRGPKVRRLTAEQFADAAAALAGEWPRMPATVDIDFSAGGIAAMPEMPKWIWTNEPHDAGEARRAEAAAIKALSPPPPPVASKRPDGNPADALKHKVVFKKVVALPDKPSEAFAALAASQAAAVFINGQRAKTEVADNSRASRIALLDLMPHLKAGENVFVIEVNSHTDKGPLNDDEARQHPGSINHINARPGVAFYANIIGCCEPVAVSTDASWRVRRAPGLDSVHRKEMDEQWQGAVPLPEGVHPVDDGPALPPIRRKDYANEKIDLGSRLAAVVSTAAFPGRTRHSLRPADPLLTALDRPNREQVATSRLSSPTTLQALELSNGEALDVLMKTAARRQVDAAAEDPAKWLDMTYRNLLSRPPSNAEASEILESLGDKPRPEALADVLWSVLMLPEFQLIL